MPEKSGSGILFEKKIVSRVNLAKAIVLNRAENPVESGIGPQSRAVFGFKNKEKVHCQFSTSTRAIIHFVDVVETVAVSFEVSVA